MMQICALALLILGLLSVPRYVVEEKFIDQYVTPVEKVAPVQPVTLFFVGDIMLGRDVENYLLREGSDYPFRDLGDVLHEPDLTIGNFEGIVQEPHVQAPSMTFQFSIRREYLKALNDAGFDVLSLSNNHSSDYGDVARKLTQELCVAYTLSCVGDARKVETAVYEVGDMRIGIVFGHTTWGNQTNDSFVSALQTLVEESDLQIAYMHWGDEYALVHNVSQQVLAEMLIDAGADVVIGHHPHVVQDITFYKGRPIFYSLGNFIFDQYWNEHVRTGLGLSMTVTEDDITYKPIPFTTLDSRNQPTPMDAENSRLLLERIFGSTTTPDSITVSRFESVP